MTKICAKSTEFCEFSDRYRIMHLEGKIQQNHITLEKEIEVRMGIAVREIT